MRAGCGARYSSARVAVEDRLAAFQAGRSKTPLAVLAGSSPASLEQGWGIRGTRGLVLGRAR